VIKSLLELGYKHYEKNTYKNVYENLSDPEINIGVYVVLNKLWTKIAVPEISAIMIPAYQEGQIASRKLIEMIESKNSISNKKVIIKNAVRWRDSTL
jgi:DNA-binding LacI/PurR family transcriptional regulator